MRSLRISPAAIFGLLILTCAPHQAHALIVGGEGNEPVKDPGWPAGADAVFNTKARVAWWEGPPFGGGEWHAECRGDAAAFNDILAAFAKIEAPKRRLIVHDGVGRSFWLDPNQEKKDGAEVDWVFVVWQPDRWTRLRRLPADLRPRTGDDAPVPQLEVYAGGRVRWADVKVPDGIEIIDRRLEAHGFQLTDGTVLEGKATDLATGASLAARVRLERVEPQPKGGYRHEPVAEARADADGRWVIKSAPAGWHRVVVDAEGYVPRVAGYGTFDGQPHWTSYDTGLSKPAPVAGRITDADRQPLAGVQVRLQNVVAEPGGLYETPGAYVFETDGDGRFRAEQVPRGRVSVWVHKPGYCRPGLGPDFTTPKDDVSLEMIKAANVVVSVSFVDATRPPGYLVRMEPKEGAAVGRWSGSGNIDAAGSIRFENVPPGTYVITGRPNPGSDAEETAPFTVDLRGGETTDVALQAR